MNVKETKQYNSFKVLLRAAGFLTLAAFTFLDL